MILWYATESVAYYHLGAYDEVGYRDRASFALFARVGTILRGPRVCVGWTWAPGRGATPSADDGLSRFKRGWSPLTRAAWQCGRVTDRAAYAELSASSESGYFPAYRAGEFA